MNFFVVFVEGVLSILSPCILPILPVYFSMLSNSSYSDMQEGKYHKNTLILNTIAFVLGISVTFFILGLSVNYLSTFISDNKSLITLIGGIVIIIMGLFYIDIININFLNKDNRMQKNYKSISIINAFVLGFTFSFGWTPCIGPILSSVLVMSASESSFFEGNMLILVYILGFIVPFLVFCIFYNALINKLSIIKKHMLLIKRICGIIIILAGIYMLVSGVIAVNNKTSNIGDNQEEITQKKEYTDIELMDFSIMDQNGEYVTLSKYKGKTVLINFFATWCNPCKEELPDINELYSKYGNNQNDVIILGAAFPNAGSEGSIEYINKFITDNKYSFPVVMDKNTYLIYSYKIDAFPTTYIFDKDGKIHKKVSGSMTKETMEKYIDDIR